MLFLFFFWPFFPPTRKQDSTPSPFTVASPKFPPVHFPNIHFLSSWTFICSCKLELIRSVRGFATATDARLAEFADLCVFFVLVFFSPLQYKLEAGWRFREGKINKSINQFGRARVAGSAINPLRGFTSLPRPGGNLAETHKMKHNIRGLRIRRPWVIEVTPSQV